LVWGFVAVAVTTAVVTSVAVVAGVFALATQHPIGTNRVGRYIVSQLPSDPSTTAIGWSLAVVGVLVLALAVTAALLIAGRVLAPVGELAEAADRVAQGDLSVRLEPRGDDEIADLAQTFNAMAESLSSSVEELRRLEANARRFASDVSHELRSPLAAMTAVTEVLSSPDGADSARAKELVVREIAHLDRLVGDLIEISRFDVGSISLDLEVLSVLDAVASSLAHRGWAPLVEVRIDAALVAVLDRRRFDVIVANLIGNAVKYGAAPIVVDAGLDGDQLVVRVTDHGPGLSPEDLELVFERFYKADVSRQRSDGSGLGLAIAQENARLHGGLVEAANIPDGGAVFTLRLPHIAELQ
jgi:two-component system sensor histidine kinase MtrB